VSTVTAIRFLIAYKKEPPRAIGPCTKVFVRRARDGTPQQR
jgi:hypothetical protein